jgi:hypothetical protein
MVKCLQCPTQPCQHIINIYNPLYYLTQDGHKITEPMTAGDIVSRFGAIRELEAQGFKVVPA